MEEGTDIEKKRKQARVKVSHFVVFLRPSKEANFSREEEEEWAGIHKHTKRRMKVKQNQNLIRKEKKQRKREDMTSICFRKKGKPPREERHNRDSVCLILCRK